jgi:tetratricopeptide (TPR) repeat protein
MSKQKFSYGVLTLTDGSQHRWSTDAEEHYLKKLAEHPDDAFNWNRLANSYLKGGRPDLAAVALEESIKIDPGQMESLYSLGRMLFDADEVEMAGRRIRQTLICAHRYDRMKAEDMRIMLTSSLQFFLDIHNDFEKFLSALPKASDMLSSGETLDESGAIIFTDLTIYPDEPESFYPLAEMYMGKRRDELPPEAQTLYQNTCVTANAAGKTPVLSGGKSKKKSGKKKKRKR